MPSQSRNPNQPDPWGAATRIVVEAMAGDSTAMLVAIVAAFVKSIAMTGNVPLRGDRALCKTGVCRSAVAPLQPQGNEEICLGKGKLNWEDLCTRRKIR